MTEMMYSQRCDVCGQSWSSTNPVQGDCHNCEGLALLADLSDELLSEVQDLLLARRPVHAIKAMWEAVQPRHSLRAAITAMNMVDSTDRSDHETTT